jgi:glucokinase
MKKILSADIGGTNSRFAFFEVQESGSLNLLESKWLNTKDSSSFGNLIENLKASDLSLKPEDADITVIAVAGPVEHRVRSSPPFISWGIDISNAEKDFGLKNCRLINDFVAQAFSCRSPVGELADEILRGEIIMDATAAVIGAGTGLGKAALVPDTRGGYIAVPSEGGHTNFPFETEREFELQEFMKRELEDSYVTGNKVVSGTGLSCIHHFLSGEKLDPKDVAERFKDNPETLEWASRFYGRECRNFALETLSLGGLYIAGGVAARTPVLVTHPAFEIEFRRSDTLAKLLEHIPVFLIKDQNSGLWGAAVMGRQILQTQ